MYTDSCPCLRLRTDHRGSRQAAHEIDYYRVVFGSIRAGFKAQYFHITPILRIEVYGHLVIPRAQGGTTYATQDGRGVVAGCGGSYAECSAKQLAPSERSES